MKNLDKENVKWAGFRYSVSGVIDSFGEEHFPSLKKWVKYINRFKSFFSNNTKGAIILIVGEVPDEDNDTINCEFGFPKPSKSLPSDVHVLFNEEEDDFEDFLKLCDNHDYDVWLQVEPGENDLVKLADIVLDQYGHHSSVKGFGIDLEWWYRNDHPDEGKKLSNKEAKKLVNSVRSRNTQYTVFAKHWDSDFMPSKYREGMIFVNDSQQTEDLETLKDEFKDWAKLYKNNPVFFQIGYEDDEKLWKDNPAKFIKDLTEVTTKYNKNVGIFWVDFTMKKFIKKKI